MNSGWLFTTSAERLFKESHASIAQSASVPPKWRALRLVVDEIREQATVETRPYTGNALVLTSDDADGCLNQVFDVLRCGCEHVWTRLLEDGAGAAHPPPADVQSMWPTGALFKHSVTAEALSALDQQPVMVVQAVRPHRLIHTLQLLRPTFIVLYQIDLFTMRTIEVGDCCLLCFTMLQIYATCQPQSIRVYLLMHRQSTEETRYLQSLRREQHAFELLIRENAVGHTDDFVHLLFRCCCSSRPTTTRRARRTPTAACRR